MIGRGHFEISREWVRGEGVERWDTVVDGRQWQKMQHGDQVFYQYERTDGVIDAHSDDWQPLEEFREAGIEPPGELPAPQETVEPSPKDEDKSEAEPEPQPIADLPDVEWDTDTFLQALQANGLDGICNGLTLAFLAGLIAPAEEQGRGLSDRRFAMVVRLKQFLDAATRGWHRKIEDEGLNEVYRSEAVTRAMQAWLTATSTRIDDVMAPGGESLFVDFWEHFDSTFLPEHRSRSEEVIQASSVTSEGLLTSHGLGNLVGALGGLFTSTQDLPPEFSGIVVVNAWRVHETGPDPGERDYKYDQFNHEFAIRFHPGSGKFVIFDQTTGMVAATVSRPEEITLVLAEHVSRGYVEHAPHMNGVPVNYMHLRVELV
ncbi:MAG: hypothetical protein DWG83_02490 [Chloroflexi bacterium]|nr:hypothetical protein [Chloroflexota bacterium]